MTNKSDKDVHVWVKITGDAKNGYKFEYKSADGKDKNGNFNLKKVKKIVRFEFEITGDSVKDIAFADNTEKNGPKDAIWIAEGTKKCPTGIYKPPTGEDPEFYKFRLPGAKNKRLTFRDENSKDANYRYMLRFVRPGEPKVIFDDPVIENGGNNDEKDFPWKSLFTDGGKIVTIELPLRIRIK